MISSYVHYFYYPGIYFDGKIDANTLGRSEAGGNTNIREDHYTVVLHFPNKDVEIKQEGVYAGFFVPDDGKGW